jgi:hypothetical protein
VPARSRANLEKRRAQIEQWIADESSPVREVELRQPRLDIDAQLAQIDQAARLPELENARESAQDYLAFAGFSRQGLIDQLSSEYGDQYPVEAATAAVDSLDVDWNAEAVEAAESYLEFQSFSHAGLVDQLSSEYGDQFTREQAEHGASTALGG